MPGREYAGHLPEQPRQMPRKDGARPEDAKMKALPLVTVDGVKFFLDERLMELRRIDRPWERIPLREYHLDHYRRTGVMLLD